MAFDGGITHKLVDELNEAAQSHIDKIYQPSRDELVFLLRKKGFAERLIISARSGAARIHFTKEKYENPDKPPMFCMLLRKHFSSARFLGAKQIGLERVIELSFEATNELGDRVDLRIVCELIGNQSNIIILGNDNRIMDAVRRSDIETSKRIIQPGALYEYPPKQEKPELLYDSIDDIVNKITAMGDIPLSKAILSCADGLSPLICREIAYRLFGEDVLTSTVSDASALKNAINSVIYDITSGGVPTLLYDQNGTPCDFSYTDISQYDSLYTKRSFNSYCELLDAFYAERELKSRISKAASDVIKAVNTLITRANKRLANRKSELSLCADREKFRIYGELIKANLHLISAGQTSAVVSNFYDENLSNIEIPLDPALSPQNNASHYFKEYKKSYTAEQTLAALIEKDIEEVLYLESVLESLSRCESLSDISEIRDELKQSGYIKSRSTDAKRKKQPPQIKEYTSAEGYKILVGKNNLQNDRITTSLASKQDLWFHVKGAAGSHVVVFCDGKPISDETLLFAARLAAKNSKAALASNIPVDYTPIKFVKKPNGAKPGMVIYTTNKTLFVTPDL